MIVYLDTSAIVKRYIVEEGSSLVNELYEKALNGDLTLSFSLWNLGETLSAFDKYYRRGWISEEGYKQVQILFKAETRRLIKLKVLKIVPIKSIFLFKSWKLIAKHHLYVADALQIVSAKAIGSDRLVTGDKKLYDTSILENLDAIYVGGS